MNAKTLVFLAAALLISVILFKSCAITSSTDRGVFEGYTVVVINPHYLRTPEAFQFVEPEVTTIRLEPPYFR